MDKKNTITAVLIGIGTAVAVLLLASLLRSLIRSVTFAEAIKTPFVWFASVLGGAGTAYSFLKKGEK